MTREELEQAIRQARKELQTAGPVHRRDLGKHIRRMQAQARRYDRLQAAARKGVA